MSRTRWHLLMLMAVLACGASLVAQSGKAKGQQAQQGTAATPCTINGKTYQDCTRGMLKQAARQAAAKARKAKSTAAGAAAAAAPAGAMTTRAAAVTAAAAIPGLGPDYFGTTPNYANSPLPVGGIGGIVPVFGGTGYLNGATGTIPSGTAGCTNCVVVSDAFGTGLGAAAMATVTSGVITGFTVTAAGVNYLAPLVTIVDAPGSLGEGANTRVLLAGITAGTGLRKFVDSLPIPPIATATPCTYSNQAADCYEIWLVEYTQKLHADLPATKLRGYVDAPGGAMRTPSYLGPIIVAQRNKPVRVTFKNMLPTGAGGNLFIPVDTTYMGAGQEPGGTADAPQNRATIHLHGGTTPWISDGTVFQWITPAGQTTGYPKGVSVYNVPDMPNPGKTAVQGQQTFYYTNQQSARLMFYHDHAEGLTRLNVYAGEAAGYVLTDPVEQALFGTSIPNTPLLGGALDNKIGIPLVIQDKTFVPSLSQLNAQDPTWKDLGIPTPTTELNGNGALWWPHVYMPNQNPYDTSGANAMGRWDYGPWFWPPFTGLIHGVVPNPYCQPSPGSNCSASPGEPPFKPGLPDSDSSNSWSYGSKASGTPESFMDTMVVNGKVYPTLTVPAAPVRFRILSVGNDRFLNLSLFLAASKNGPTTAGATGTPILCTGGVAPADCTEVAMVPFNSLQNTVTPFPSWWYTIISNGFTFDDRAGGVPDPRRRGPAMIQIGTEGGLLPEPALIRNQPVNYVYNRRDITVGNIAQKALFLGPAERADVIVDFSKFAGSTLILYNDSPAPVPAADPRLDYYTGSPDNTDTGGAPSTQPGYGPNTRTVMQIVVQGSGGTNPPDDYNPALYATLQTALPTAFKASEDLIIVPQAAYDGVYGTVTADSPGTTFSTIQGTSMTFAPLNQDGTRQATPILFPMQPKSIIENFTLDYGRMNALLGVEIPNTNITNQTSIPLGYADPQVDIVKVTDPALTPIGQAADGTQLWKITHNGVDTHAIHFHMFNVQVVNRVGWDGAIRPPDPNELGFKDTVRMNPLEDIIVATRPVQLTGIPFKIPNSIRPLAPSAVPGGVSTPTGAPLFTNVDPNGNPVTVTNQPANFGWEYVWHCHILGHEENDMMHALSVVVPPETPSGLKASLASPTTVNLSWIDNSMTANSYTVQRCADAACLTVNATIGPTAVAACTATAGCPVSAQDTGGSAAARYYRIVMSNTVGSGVPGYPSLTADSAWSPIVQAVGTPHATVTPTSLLFGNRAVGSSTVLTVALGNTGTAALTFSASVTGGAPLYFSQANSCTGTVAIGGTCTISVTFAPTTAGARTASLNLATNDPANLTLAVPLSGTGVVAGPAAPSNLTATLLSGPTRVQLSWRDNSNNENLFQVWRSVNGGTFTQIATVTRTNAQRTATGGTVTFTNTGTFVAGSTYAYYVIAVNTVPIPNQSSTPSNTATVTVTGLPAAPTNLRVTGVTRTTISVAWNDNSNNEVDFEIQYLLGGANWTQAAIVPANTTAYTGTWAPNWTIQYRVRARNAAGNSAWSNTVTAATLP
jgi:FtsP/CotA-like multicopper oxidase with cupredoxin domain